MENGVRYVEMPPSAGKTGNSLYTKPGQGRRGRDPASGPSATNAVMGENHVYAEIEPVQQGEESFSVVCVAVKPLSASNPTAGRHSAVQPSSKPQTTSKKGKNGSHTDTAGGKDQCDGLPDGRGEDMRGKKCSYSVTQPPRKSSTTPSKKNGFTKKMAEKYAQALKETIIFAQENPMISSIMDRKKMEFMKLLKIETEISPDCMMSNGNLASHQATTPSSVTDGGGGGGGGGQYPSPVQPEDTPTAVEEVDCAEQQQLAAETKPPQLKCQFSYDVIEETSPKQ